MLSRDTQYIFFIIYIDIDIDNTKFEGIISPNFFYYRFYQNIYFISEVQNWIN